MKSFSIRSSGSRAGKFYIDCSGLYAIGDISAMTGTDKKTLEDIYTQEGSEFDDSTGVHYFPSREAAAAAVVKLERSLNGFGKTLFLTLEEIEYIRQALINEGSNIINVRNDLKKCIFDKFNT